MFKTNSIEDIEYLKQNIPIQFYAETVLGITEWIQMRGGKIKPLVKFQKPNSDDMSSLVVDLEKNCFWRNSGRGRNPSGSILDFIMNTADVDISDAIQILVDFGNQYLSNSIDVESVKKQNKKLKKQNSMMQQVKDFSLPLKYKNTHRLYAYIVQHREIEKDVYDYFMNNHFMYQSWDCKCIFVSYDNEVPVFACVRDTNWNERITYGVAGSFVDHGFYIDNHSNTLVVTEAVIDAMAYMSLLSLQNKDYKTINYLALTGCSKIQCIKYHLEKDKKINRLILAFDKDKAGKTANKKAREMLNEMKWNGEIIDYYPVHGKDVNDELIYFKEDNK